MSRLAAMWRTHRVAILVVCVLSGAALTAALIWPITDLIAAHDVGRSAPALRAAHLQTAREAARTQLLTLGAGLFAAGALIYTARNFALSRRTVELTEQGQVTDRYTKAIEQLGSEKLDVRIGGIYALERVASDSTRDHPTVLAVLSAFVREHSHEPWPRGAASGAGREAPRRTPRPDVQAAATVIGRRDGRHDRGPVELDGADLSGADLRYAHLEGVHLVDAQLAGTRFFHADLTRAALSGANLRGALLPAAQLFGAVLAGSFLSGADLNGADLSQAKLFGADLQGAQLRDANLRDALLRGADLGGALLFGANLEGADLSGALLVGADMVCANLKGANLMGAFLRKTRLLSADLTGSNLTGADLTDACFPEAILTDALWPSDAGVPAGWQRSTGSDRLRKADTTSDSAAG